ncbi:MAG TPA: hypothetical protein VN754_01620 [Candidatus Binataceae bacterium]|nr:hypothetical protein [Candidatus Binataceae bacterium]
MFNKLPLISLFVAFAATVTILASCAPTYDSIADQMLVDTQKQADDGLLKLESLAVMIDTLGKSPNASDQKAVADARRQASYGSNMDFYNNLQSSLTTLDTRMTATPDLSTPKLNNALSNLEKNVNEVRTTHAAENTLGADYVKASKQILDQQFKALTVYELTIKSGSKPQ